MDNSEESGQRTERGLRPGTVFGVVAGSLFGVVVVLLAGTAFAQHVAADAAEPVLEATHLPPLLTAPGERVDLRYDAFCVFPESAEDTVCDVDGAVFVRAGTAGPFHESPLRESGGAADGRFGAVVPARSREHPAASPTTPSSEPGERYLRHAAGRRRRGADAELRARASRPRHARPARVRPNPFGDGAATATHHVGRAVLGVL